MKRESTLSLLEYSVEEPIVYTEVKVKVLILAGGGGTRLWPLSRQEFPKQFFRFGRELSLLQKTVDRFLKAPFIDDIVISTSGFHQTIVQLQLQEIDEASRCKILAEPCKRNTGPAIALGVNFLQTFCKANPSDMILVLPSDHLIEPESVFLQFVEHLQESVGKGRIALFGIRPTRPETGYGYIRIGDPFDQYTHSALSFLEKPDLALAEKFAQSPLYYWNAGIFAFTPAIFKQEIATHSPSLLRVMEDPFASAIAQYANCPDISIDYALMEKSRNIVVCPLPVKWSDVGCWESIYEVMDKDHNQNVKVGNVVDFETKNSLILGSKRLISTIGLEDVLIVETEDATFISKKGQSQKLKQIVEQWLGEQKKEVIRHLTQQYPWGSLQQFDEWPGGAVQKLSITSFQMVERTLAVDQCEVVILISGSGDILYKEERIPIGPLRIIEEGVYTLCSAEALEIVVVQYASSVNGEKSRETSKKP